MTTIEQIEAAYKTATNYKELVSHLIELGMLSYTVEVSAEITFFRLTESRTEINPGHGKIREVATTFSEFATRQAIQDSQSGLITYPQFLDAIATAGVRVYEATLNGNDKNVTYMGNGGHYTELIPIL